MALNAPALACNWHAHGAAVVCKCAGQAAPSIHSAAISEVMKYDRQNENGRGSARTVH